MLRLVQQRAVVAQREALSACPRLASLQARHLHSSRAALALSKFVMPAMSPTMTEGGIAVWKKKEGETFAPGDVLVEIETDKATMDVEAQDEGFLAKIMVGDGSKAIPVGTSIAILAEEGDDVSSSAIEALLAESEEGGSDAAPEAAAPPPPPPAAEPKKAEAAAPTPAPVAPSPPAASTLQPSSDRPYVLASPIAKRLALEQGIPLSSVVGTGPGGRVIKADIEAYKAPVAAPAVAAPTPAAPAASTPAPAAASSSKAAAPSTAAYTDTPVSNMRRVIASRLTESKTGAPHYYLTVEVNMDRVLKLRELFNSAAKSAESAGGLKEGVKGGVKLSVNDFIVKASSMALQDVPEANSGWHGDFVRHYHTQDISIAVATPNGLITPIVTDVGAKGLSTISSQTKALAARAREGKLKPEEYQGGSFTISNLGMMGIESFTAIINPPQSCILAIGATEKKLVLDEESARGFKEVSVMKATLSCDHRVVDGAVGAKWMKSFKAYLESPLSFML